MFMDTLVCASFLVDLFFRLSLLYLRRIFHLVKFCLNEQITYDV